MLFKNIKLDTNSEYMCDEKNWPKACCDVKVEDDKFIDIARLMFDKEPEDGYTDAYAIIDPERKLVTEFLLIFKDLGGTQEETTIKVTDVADSVEYYMILEEQGGCDFKTFIADAIIRIHSERMAQVGLFSDVVDDFLEEKGVRIPSSDEEMKAAGDDPENNPARIYGPDYEDLTNDFEKLLKYGLENVIKDRIQALSKWQAKYTPDEDLFYSILFEAGYTGRQIEDAVGEDAAFAVKKYWEEHGFI